MRARGRGIWCMHSLAGLQVPGALRFTSPYRYCTCCSVDPRLDRASVYVRYGVPRAAAHQPQGSLSSRHLWIASFILPVAVAFTYALALIGPHELPVRRRARRQAFRESHVHVVLSTEQQVARARRRLQLITEKTGHTAYSVDLETMTQ